MPELSNGPRLRRHHSRFDFSLLCTTIVVTDLFYQVDFFAMKPVIRKEPKGTVLIITPFNFPLLLSIPPVVGILHWILLERS